jgi:hypothetical protein
MRFIELFNRCCSKISGFSLEDGEESLLLGRTHFVSYPLLLGRDSVSVSSKFCLNVLELCLSGLVLGLFVGGFVG